MKFTSRLLAIICYFSPFIFFVPSCNGLLSYVVAYNPSDAAKNALADTLASASVTDKSIDSLSTINTIVDSSKIANAAAPAPIDTKKKDDIWEKLKMKIVMPTSNSLSGIGIIMIFEYIRGQILIASSLILSLSVLFAGKYLTRRNWIKYLLMANLLCLILFVIDCYISNISLMWGIWALLVLLTLQLVIAIKENRQAV